MIWDRRWGGLELEKAYVTSWDLLTRSLVFCELPNAGSIDRAPYREVIL